MKRALSVILPLVAIAAGVGLLTGAAFQLLEKKLDETKKTEERALLSSAVPGASSFVEKEWNGKNYILALDDDGNSVGVIFRLSRSGYGGPVEALVGMTNRAVVSVKVVSMDRETPGLGTKAAKKDWLDRFAGADGKNFEKKQKNAAGKDVDSITGATLTSGAILKIIRSALRYNETLAKGQKSDGDMDADSGASMAANDKGKSDDDHDEE